MTDKARIPQYVFHITELQTMNTVEEGVIARKKEQEDTDVAIDLEKGRGKEGLDSCATGNFPVPDTGFLKSVR